MQRYRCPQCKVGIELKKVFDNRYIILCRKCNFLHLSKESQNNEDEAYVEFLEQYDLEKIEKVNDISEALKRFSLARTNNEILQILKKEGINKNDIPDPIRKFIFTEEDYLVKYKLQESQKPEMGRNIDELEIDQRMIAQLKDNGIKRLYSFQEETINQINSGKDVGIVSPTGSGKTEAFAIPVIQSIANKLMNKDNFSEGKTGIKALFVYPTKSLGRDQFPKLKLLCESVGIRIGIFDGDTTRKEREKIIENPPEIIITNFDSIHHHIMNRTRFSESLHEIKFIVIDEVHVYKGTFGSNVHFILRRLERLNKKYQIIASSATINNPKEFCDALFGKEITIINGESGRHGKIHFIILFPTIRSNRSLIIDILKSTTASGNKPIAFSNSHLGAELTAFYGKRNNIQIEVHRAGLLTKHRLNVEQKFKNGELQAISATSTLEMGIDIGKVDTIISDLVPITRLTQRAGRASRRDQEGAVFLTLRGNDPISQYYKNNPEQYFEDEEKGYVDPDNEEVAEFQILAASMDKPISNEQFTDFRKVTNRLLAKGLLVNDKEVIRPNYQKAREILTKYNIRGVGKTVDIINNKKIGERTLPQALDELHPGAIYFLGGRRYRSKSLTMNDSKSFADVEILPRNYPYYTKSLIEEYPKIIEEIEKKKVFNIEVIRCVLEIKKKVVGYTNIEVGSEKLKGEKTFFENPINYEFKTKGIVLLAPQPEDTIKEKEFERIEDIASSSFHASEHVIIEGSNMIIGGASSDMGGISLGSSGLIFVYDSSPGGNGATRTLYERFPQVFEKGYKMLVECNCTSESGCPRCTYSYRCGNNNEYLHREGAIEVIKRILEGEETYFPKIIEKEWRPLV